MSMYYRYGEAAALRDLGLEKTALGGPPGPGEIALGTWEQGFRPLGPGDSGFDMPVPGARKPAPPPGVPRNMDALNAHRARRAAAPAAHAATAAAAAPVAHAATAAAEDAAPAIMSVMRSAPAASTVATEAATEAPGLMRRMMSGVGNTKIPVKALAGIGAVAGGAYLANKAMSDPHVEVHPTLPMRTMYS